MPATIVMVVVVVVCTGVVARMPRKMDVRLAGVPRDVGFRRVHVRHLSSAEEQLHDHEDGKQQSHGNLAR
jgi:hypothetical protein